jgi:monofunctional biosynthetic peptidoglycan transglycosylase
LGFDVGAIEKAYQLNQHSHRVRGASTISQQVAKNLYLWSGRSYLRKGLEAYFTILIEGFWPKRRILEIYLNIAEFGDGVYGAEAAAQRFFRKPAAQLTRADAAILAAVLPNPQRFSAAAPSRYVRERSDWILNQMQALGGPEMLGEIDAYPNRRR